MYEAPARLSQRSFLCRRTARALVFRFFVHGFFTSTKSGESIDKWFNQNIVLTCHSQGNLIVSCALYGFKVLGMGTSRPFPPRPIHVFAIASPAVSWPGKARVKCYTHGDDIVTWASFGQSYRSVAEGRSKGSTVLTSGRPFAAKGGVPDHHFSIYSEEQPFIRDLRKEFGLPPGPSPEPLLRLKTPSLPVYKARR
jgi:hypothetical protein